MVRFSVVKKETLICGPTLVINLSNEVPTPLTVHDNVRLWLRQSWDIFTETGNTFDHFRLNLDNPASEIVASSGACYKYLFIVQSCDIIKLIYVPLNVGGTSREVSPGDCYLLWQQKPPYSRSSDSISPTFFTSSWFFTTRYAWGGPALCIPLHCENVAPHAGLWGFHSSGCFRGLKR